jgi:hypothetical protein
MAGTHSDVGHAEVEELACGFLIPKTIKAHQVLFESGLQSMIEQVFHGEVFGEE